MAKQSGKSRNKAAPAAPKGKEKTAKAAGKAGKDDGKRGNKEYARELRKLHVELVKMQEWVKHAGLKVCIVFGWPWATGSWENGLPTTPCLPPPPPRRGALRLRP